MNSTTAEIQPQRKWRDLYPVHPCAEVFPMMSTGEIDELAADIKANGLREPAILWMNPADKMLYLIDGRNRLEALERNGISPGTAGLTIRILETREIVNPAAFVISANIQRRHLTKQQQADLIVAAIQANSATAATEVGENTSSLNDVAKLARSFNPTEGQRGGSTKDPVVQAAIHEGKKHGISARTIHRARAKVHGVKAPKPVTHKTADTAPSETTIRAKTTAALNAIESLVTHTVKQWPTGHPLSLLVQFLWAMADDLNKRDEATHDKTRDKAEGEQHVDPTAIPAGSPAA